VTAQNATRGKFPEVKTVREDSVANGRLVHGDQIVSIDGQTWDPPPPAPLPPAPTPPHPPHLAGSLTSMLTHFNLSHFCEQVRRTELLSSPQQGAPDHDRLGDDLGDQARIWHGRNSETETRLQSSGVAHVVPIFLQASLRPHCTVTPFHPAVQARLLT